MIKRKAWRDQCVDLAKTGAVRVWDVTGQLSVEQLQDGGAKDASFAADDRIVTLAATGSIRRFDTSTPA